ncbi:MAG: c-type cytochrome [Acidimicrobiales bacterium]
MHLLLAATSQQRRIGTWVVVVMLAGWVLYLISSTRRTYVPGEELEIAPNRKPYLDDEAMEGPRLTRFLWWAFATLVIVSIGLPLYWLREPYRQRGPGLERGIKYFDAQAVARGKRAFQATPGDPPTPREPHYGCENCHGVNGVGGVASYTLTDPARPDAPPQQVQWAAPALNTVMLRYRPEEVLFILTYGRVGTPMPAWGVAGGGALDDQQLSDLIAYLQSIQLDSAKVKADALATYGTDGSKLFDAYCARCHTLGWSYGQPGVTGGGAFGPSINNGSTLRQFPTPQLQVQWVAKTAEVGKQYGVRGISKGVMPHFEDMLSSEQIRAIVDYERGI